MVKMDVVGWVLADLINEKKFPVLVFDCYLENNFSSVPSVISPLLFRCAKMHTDLFWLVALG